MRELAPGLWLVEAFADGLINAYLADGMLIDSTTRRAAHRVLSELTGHDVQRHVLTHGHPDHQGSSHAVCEALGLPLLVGEEDAAAVESGDLESILPDSENGRRWIRATGGPGHPVAAALREGDTLGPWTVIEVPGHTPGHIALWRDRDRALIIGDVFVNVEPISMRPGLGEPPPDLTWDAELNRASGERLAELAPELVCFGHGPPVRGRGAFAEAVAQLLNLTGAKAD
jgi:hydroxyacylglutathione hydrolase